METKNSIAVFTFGRFNPITKGHEKLFKKVHELAIKKNGTSFVFPSWSHGKNGKKQNPLSFDVKVKFIKKMMPWVNVIREETVKTPWDVPKYLSECGFTEIYLVAGSDRIEEYEKRWKPFAETYASIGVITAGFRDPDDNGIIGMSATKAHQAALSGDVKKFELATGWSGTEARVLMEAVVQKL